MELYYPVKNPINQSNLFGANPAEYASLGQKGHPGIDFEAPLDTPFYCPVAGDAFYTKDPDGGDGIWIRVTDSEGNHYNVILWHLPPGSDPIYHPLIPISDTDPVTPVKAGQDLGWTGNSGYPLESTGPHLHVGVMPCNAQWAALNPDNGFNGCVDPMQFFTGKYAADINATPVTEAVAPVIEAANDLVQKTAQETAQETATPSQKEIIIAKVETFLEELKQLL